ncbi:MAG: beta-propeller domain-containing protein [Candidatus Bathyarchaeota archaeon]|nr:beta-propeller domain-containing protein [Candidatus Bathyarchaeota archaeon]MDH5787615.1 beta-propeller domain-containing protein [Candidatus Bathyarchaeota archaeon]
MESKLKRKTVIYGIAAISLASVLTALIFSFNLIELGYTPGESPISAPQSPLLTSFESDEQLKDFLKSNSGTREPFWIYGPLDTIFLGSMNMMATVESGTVRDAAPSHSTTNIQVAGVDEADIVKVDDRGYMFVLSGNVVYILKAYPPTDAEIVSTLVFEDMSPIGIFVYEDKLAVFGSEYRFPTIYDIYYLPDIKTFVKVYDVEDPSDPLIVRDFTISGSYFNSRMIGNYVYFVVSKAAYLVNDTLCLPEINSDGNIRQIAPTEIRYFNGTDDYYQYTTFVAMNIQNVTEAPVYLPIMLGGTCNMYVSLTNIYVTYRDWSWNSNTTIYRIRIEGSNMTCEATGTVLGRERNQFSMDEYGDYFRIETTTWTQDWSTSTNLYVLDMNLSIVGRLEGLAPGENFHSARFMGNRAYFVTFKKTDPLFVIDLSQPTNPSVLGELHIPGYSDYLHPYDENHLIGVGKHTVEAEEGDFAWYQGIKISLFDVTDVENPIQMSNVTIGDRGSDSPVLYDHKAFLFDRSKNLLVIPVLEAEIDPSKYPGEIPPYAYGDPVWQGAYVYDISLFHGFVLKGRIAHLETGVNIHEESYWVKRSLYIEDVLYTISNRKVKLNTLEDLYPIIEIDLF